ncbi:MAG: permease [Elusimicrobia bacterium]|nr:permease [Elusimicrobiota bacterium]
MFELISSFIAADLLNLNKSSKFYEIIHFFIYDSLKIFFMLFFFVAVLAFLRSYVSDEKINFYIGSKKISSYFFAALFGAITPFCSCSSLPLFISFIKSSVPLGVAFSFLVTSPLVNEYLAVLMLGFFGYKVTLVYVLNGILLGVIVGKIADKYGFEKYVLRDIKPEYCESQESERFDSFYSRVKYGFNESTDIIKKMWLWILGSVLLGSLIHGYVPKENIEKIVSFAGFMQVPAAVAVGVPLYGGCVSILPIAYVLFSKGIPLGTVLSFLMAVSALSLPEAIMLRRVIKTELILIFFSIVSLGIILIGYMFNFLQVFLI